MQPTNYIAIYAAIISTLGLAWNIVQWCKQRGKLNVRAAICKSSHGYTEEIEPGQWSDLLRIDVVNSGKANITLVGICLKTATSKPFCFWRSYPQVQINPSASQIPLPHTLEPTKTVYWLLDTTDILLNLYPIKKFFIKDSHGKEWHASKKQVKYMEKVILFEQTLRNAKSAPKAPSV